MNVIIDSDFGVDDTFCIEYMLNLHNSQKCNILGITTVCGNIKAKNAYLSGKYIFKNIFKSDIDVFYSPESSQNDNRCNYFYGEDGHYDIIKNNTDYNLYNYDKISSVQFMLNKLNNCNNITIIAIGPLTNLSECERIQPGILSKAKQILIMGGAVNVPGNITKKAEYNFYIDPNAIIPVIKNNNVVIFPLDITLNVKYSYDQLVKKFSNSNFYKYIINGMYKQEILTNEIPENSNYVIIHDPITALYFENPGKFLVNKDVVNIDKTDGNIFISKHGYDVSIAYKLADNNLVHNFTNKI